MEKIVSSSSGNAAFQGGLGVEEGTRFPGGSAAFPGGSAASQPPLPGLLGIGFPKTWAGSPLAGKDAGVTPVFILPTSSRQVKAHTEELLMLTRSDLPRSDHCLLAPDFWLPSES